MLGLGKVQLSLMAFCNFFKVERYGFFEIFKSLFLILALAGYSDLRTMRYVQSPFLLIDFSR